MCGVGEGGRPEEVAEVLKGGGEVSEKKKL
jgi:hypothetical protein